jgi:hypothetical protein
MSFGVNSRFEAKLMAKLKRRDKYFLGLKFQEF